MASDDMTMTSTRARGGLKTIVSEMKEQMSANTTEAAEIEETLNSIEAGDTNETVMALLKELELGLKADMAGMTAEMDRKFTIQSAENKRLRHDCETVRTEHLAAERRVVGLEQRMGTILRGMGLEDAAEEVGYEEEDEKEEGKDRSD